MRDHGQLYLRVATAPTTAPELLRVITSEPLDKHLIEEIGGDLGEITVSPDPGTSAPFLAIGQGAPPAPLDNGQPGRAFSAGVIPARASSVDPQIDFPVPLQVVDWSTGERQRAGALARVATRPSVLYARLFAALGDYARGVEYILFSIAAIFAIIEVSRALRRHKTYAQHHFIRSASLRGNHSCESRGLQPPHHRYFYRSTRDSRKLIQLDDRLHRKAGAGAERKAAPGE